MFYAYKPNADGAEPIGSNNRLLRYDLKDTRYFVKLAHKLLGPDAVCFHVGSFYDSSTFKKVN